jgi:2-phosphosulfolactate phosphatase
VPVLAHFDWGPAGAAHAGDRGVLVVVDVLSFTTSVTVAVERGVAVTPAAREVREARPWALSPAALAAAPALEDLVLPSPNGSAIAAAAPGLVVAACLRNARAVAAWLTARGDDVVVIAAGERWPDGSLRPALEDLLGAGAVLAALGADESAEAAAARAAYAGTPSVADALRRCVSGVELIDGGYAEDVELAAQVDASGVVPVLRGGAFRGARG